MTQPASLPDYTAALAAVPRRRDQLLPALHALHDLAGWLPEAAIEAAGRHVFVPLSEVYGIVTSYSEFRLTAPHPERVEVCTGLSCRIAGADALLTAARAQGIHIEQVPCRFLCAVAPVVETPEETERTYHGRASSVAQRGVPSRSFLSRASVSSGAGAGSLAERRAFAVERAQHEASRARLIFGDGVCARAVGSRSSVPPAVMAAGAFGTQTAVAWVAAGCDGSCYAQPLLVVHGPHGDVSRFERVASADTPRIIAAVQGKAAHAERTAPAIEVRRVLRNCGVIDPESFAAALAAGAYLGFEKALAMQPAEVVELVRASGLRGRGGAYFPTAIKWDSARQHPGPRYLVVNAEEGEPGVFKDRHLMEGDPHALVEGVLIAAYAVGAEHAFIYINGQAQLSARRVELAVKDAREAGLIGENILGSGFSCAIAIYRGAGGYVCGEESVILNSIEGERAVPRFRPPLPTERGLFGRPTVINNVETLVNLPLILTEGVDPFRSVGTPDFPGTKLISLSGAVRRPGLYEVPMGTTIQSIIEACGGGAQEGHTLTAAVVGGPSGGLMPASMFDVPIQGGMLHPSGPVLGAGGIVVLDERTPLAFALRELTAYNRSESCGKCTPCREGTDRALALLEQAGDAPLTAEQRAELLELCEVMQTASLCGLGQMAPGPIRSALTLFERD